MSSITKKQLESVSELYYGMIENLKRGECSQFVKSCEKYLPENKNMEHIYKNFQHVFILMFILFFNFKSKYNP